MLNNRVLMAKFDPAWAISTNAPYCDCGEPMYKGDLVAMYPIHGQDLQIREICCLTCHFWVVHEDSIIRDMLDEAGL